MPDYTKVSVFENSQDPEPKIRVYRKRWLILGLYVFCCTSSVMQWLQYSIIANTVVNYYGVSYTAADWSSMIFLLLFIPFIFPGCYVLDTWGIRISTLIGMSGTSVGSWIKMLSVSPDRYWVVLLGQGIVGISQIFLLQIPPKLAAVWFGANQVSLACSIGVLGLQMGAALGFLLPSALIGSHKHKDIIEQRLHIMTITTALSTTVLLAMVYIFFKERPPSPPSLAQHEIEVNEKKSNNFLQNLKALFTNASYMVLVVSDGICIGVFYAISTLLNQIILKHYPDGAEDAGRIGLVFIFSGMIGSITLSGIVLDAFKRFKETFIMVYVFCLLSMIGFTFILNNGITSVYLVAASLGFFIKPLLPLGYQLAVELTYPLGEATSSGILFCTAQIFGIAFTHLYSYLLNSMTDKIANLTMSGLLGLGLSCLVFIKFDLRRQNVQNYKK